MFPDMQYMPDTEVIRPREFCSVGIVRLGKHREYCLMVYEYSLPHVGDMLRGLRGVKGTFEDIREPYLIFVYKSRFANIKRLQRRLAKMLKEQ